jgi:hypothetical protein
MLQLILLLIVNCEMGVQANPLNSKTLWDSYLRRPGLLLCQLI